MTLNNNHVYKLVNGKKNNSGNGENGNGAKKSTWIDRFATYEAFAFIGIIMIIGTLFKLLGYLDFSSDWFWLLAGVGLVIEGSISLIKQRRFDRKYKIIERKE